MLRQTQDGSGSIEENRRNPSQNQRKRRTEQTHQEGFDQEHQGPKSQLTSPSIHGTASQPHSRGNALMMFANWRPNAYSDYIWQI